MVRREILGILNDYEEAFQDEAATVQRIRELVENHSDCFDRTCIPGHVTGSAWIVSADLTQHLLTHHRKLNRWLQVGGHADGDSSPFNVALREACEESGMDRFLPVKNSGRLLPLDIDVHSIPARHSEPEHEHHDLRYLLIADRAQEITVSHESHDVRWFTVDQVMSLTDEPGIHRMLRKSNLLLNEMES
jgi:8-oxo-dGTP pyrophosphatase MutT (NUDIX family)